VSDESRSFLRRWSRLKRESQQPQQATEKRADEPPPLPPLEELGADSDYSGFMHPKVDPDLRRAALKKLFSSERFQSMDGLDVYVGDYSNPEPLAAGVAAMLRHASTVLAQGDTQAPAEGAPPEAGVIDRTVSEGAASPEPPVPDAGKQGSGVA